MEVDIRTVVLIIGIFRLIQILVFYHQYKAAKNLTGPGWWLLWSLTDALGSVVILLRSSPTLLPFAIVLQNPIIVTGGIFMYFGLLRFFDSKANLRFILPYFISYFALHCFFFFIIDNADIRSLLLYVFFSATAFLSAITVYKYKTPSIALTANANSIILLIHGSIFVFRLGMIIAGIPSPSMFSPALVNFLIYSDALIVGLLLTFGFIIMLNQFLNNETTEAKRHFELIFNSGPEAVVISKLEEGVFVDVNEGFTRLSGYSKDDLMGTRLLDSSIWRNEDDKKKIAGKIREKGCLENMEILFERKDGELFTCLLSSNIITLKGNPHLITVTHDISDRKRAEEEIQLKNEELERLNIEKDKFFSLVAHDLISPFNAFLGLTELMVEELPGRDMDNLMDLAKNMRHSADNLYRLIENILEWSRMERGLIPFNPAVVSLYPFMMESIDVVFGPAKSKEIEIVIDIPEDTKIFVDSKIFQTVIRNLVSNAVKFTPRGGKVFLSAVSSTDNELKICVRDTGIGMDSVLLGNLFRLDRQYSRNGTEGEVSTGLGLIICKDYVEKHGGKIEVESEEGEGSSFCVTIPGSGLL